MKKFYNIALIGTGNVAWHLGPALENAGHHITALYGRDKKRGKQMLDRLFNAEWHHDLDFSSADLDVILVCVSDQAIAEIAKDIILPDGAVLAHTSGAMPMNELEYAAADAHGVFYPLQTFTKGKEIDIEEVPFLIETSEKWATARLVRLAETISHTVKEVDSKQRKHIHLSAVFACNFTNFMMLRSAQIMEQQNLSFELMHPLIAETINKTLEIGPKAAQTGPAVRKDIKTLDAHLELMDEQQEWAEMYQEISQQIIDEYYKKEERSGWDI